MKHTKLRTAAALLAAAVLLCQTISAAPAALTARPCADNHAAVTAASSAPSVSAQSAILLDCCSGRVLFEKDGDSRHLIASTTKIMTALVVIESCDLEARVKIMPEAVGIEGSSMYLRKDEVLSVRELLLGLMLHSGNDAAVALAIFCGGTVEAFVGRMNDTAERLGLTQSHFANPNGLDDDQNYATARDLAVLAMYALENETFREIVSTKTATAGGRTLTNHNKLLWRVDGAVGVKTGYTRSAGRILVGAAERDGRRLVSVTINAPSDWADHAALLDYGFEAFSTRTVLEAGQRVAWSPVLSGDCPIVYAVAAEPFSYSLLADEQPELVVHLPRMIFGPVAAGDPAGRVDLVLGSTILGSVPLVWEGAKGG